MERRAKVEIEFESSELAKTFYEEFLIARSKQTTKLMMIARVGAVQAGWLNKECTFGTGTTLNRLPAELTT